MSNEPKPSPLVKRINEAIRPVKESMEGGVDDVWGQGNQGNPRDRFIPEALKKFRIGDEVFIRDHTRHVIPRGFLRAGGLTISKITNDPDFETRHKDHMDGYHGITFEITNGAGQKIVVELGDLMIGDIEMVKSDEDWSDR